MVITLRAFFDISFQGSADAEDYNGCYLQRTLTIARCDDRLLGSQPVP